MIPEGQLQSDIVFHPNTDYKLLSIVLGKWYAKHQGVYCCDGHYRMQQAIEHRNALFATGDWA